MLDRPMIDRRSANDVQVADYFRGEKRFFDAAEKISIVKIFSGDWHVSTQGNEMITTILGSCVSACIRDPVLGVGGMNHFLLPGEDGLDSQVSDSARYGVFAMESLINGILNAGGRKDRFEIKVFGGGNVINNSTLIGSRNAEFIRAFLRREGFRITSEDLEGDYPRRVHYFPDTGKVMLRQLRRREDKAIVEEEARYTRQMITKLVEGDIELF
ncbi:MAG: chemoreceptor glutamine deamidase CheD [Alphaproteobacteria bacterium]|nr:chemoreceptor glutamine deamidase CheD [Alphaproteobacteria bacterium]